MYYLMNEIPKQVYIYCLINPLDNNVFYVGATSKELKDRLYAHYYETSNNRKKFILDEIKMNNKSAEILLLETVKFNEVTFNENFYINLFRSYGFTLTNRRCSDYCKSLGSQYNTFIKLNKLLKQKRT